MQKYLEDQYLLLAVGVITTPALVVLIIQASIDPITLHSHAKINEVSEYSKVLDYSNLYTSYTG